MTQTGNSHETLFKPHMNINPLVEANSKVDTAVEEPKNDDDAVYSKPDPEVVKSKSMNKRIKTENITAVVNEFFDEEEPPHGELPDLPPAELTAIDETKEDSKEDIKEDTKESDKPDDNTPNNNATDTEPLITRDSESSTTQNIVSVDEDKAIDINPSSTSKDAPANENIKAEEDTTAEIHTTMVNEEQTLIAEQEIVATITNEEEAEGEVKGDADNVPLIDVKKSTTKTPSSPGKFGLRVNLYK